MNLTLELPPKDARDQAMGRYMDAWSRLEGMLNQATREMLEIDPKTASAIASSMMTRQAIDLFEASAKLRLSEEGIAKAAAIHEKLLRRNLRRNHIVHGEWRAWTVVQDTSFTCEWVRTYNHVDPDKSKPWLTDPALLGLYTFTIQELDKTTAHVDEMVEALAAFIVEIPALRAAVS